MSDSRLLNALLTVVLFSSPIWSSLVAPRVAHLAIFNLSYISRERRVVLAIPQFLTAMCLIWIPLAIANATFLLLSPAEANAYEQSLIDANDLSTSPGTFLTFNTIWICVALAPFLFLSARFATVWAIQYRLPRWTEELISLALVWCILSTVCFYKLNRHFNTIDEASLVPLCILVTAAAVLIATPLTAPVGIVASSVFYAWMLRNVLETRLGPLEFSVDYGLFYFSMLAFCAGQVAILRSTTLNPLEASILSVSGPLRPR